MPPPVSNRQDPICGMPGVIERHGHWFCSEGCIARYERRIRGSSRSAGLDWIRQPTLWAFLVVALPLALGKMWAPARPIAQALWYYLDQAGWAVALGLLLGGIVDHYVPKEYISIWLSRPRRRVILTSAGLGFLASSCSHGCLALTIELYRKGASRPAAITFLLASPWASLSLTFLIASLMGWKGLLIVLMALVIAVTTGLIFQQLEHRGLLDSNPHTVAVEEGFSIGRDFKERWGRRSWTARALWEDLEGIVRGSWGLAQMVLVWVSIGFTASAIVGTVIPHEWWSRWFGPTVVGLFMTMGIATVVEVCSEGTAPLAVELYKQTGALGNAFAFLMGGVVTDFTELSLIWGTMGRKTVGWLLLVTLPQVFLLGLFMNQWRGGG